MSFATLAFVWDAQRVASPGEKLPIKHSLLSNVFATQ